MGGEGFLMYGLKPVPCKTALGVGRGCAAELPQFCRNAVVRVRRFEVWDIQWV
jgi:hypothetical protein